jgi:hypothetical protein
VPADVDESGELDIDYIMYQTLFGAGTADLDDSGRWTWMTSSSSVGVRPGVRLSFAGLAGAACPCASFHGLQYFQ